MKFIVALIIAVLPFSGYAGTEKPAAYSGNYKIEKYVANYDVNSDGTHAETHDLIITALTEEGVKKVNQASISYSESLQEVIINSALTVKNDGRRIEVPPSNIQERSAIAGGGPMYSDIKTRVIIFPDVTIGDKVVYSYKLVQKKALFPGHFSIAQAFSKFVVYDDVRIRVSVPANTLKLQVFSLGVQGGPKEDAEGRHQWIWTYKNREIAPPESGSVDPMDYGPRIIVSSFKDYKTIAASYEERAKPKALVTEKIKKLAEDLTRGVTDQREQAKILYEWVTKNIHHAGNRLGEGSVVPHDSDMILDNRLGDCKDHVVILQALLSAKGIDSTPVLINAGSSYKLPDVPTPRIFNHVINYIPSLDIYLDSTSEFTPFGLLPVADAGKPVIYTARFTGIQRTPLVNYKTTTSAMKLDLHFHEDGSADGETSVTETGILSGSIKAYMVKVEPHMEDLIVRKIIANSGFTGTGTLVKADPLNLSDQYTYGMKYNLTHTINVPGPGAIYVTPVLPGQLSISSFIYVLTTPDRTLDSTCMGGISIEEYTLDFPNTVKIQAVPKDVHVTDGVASYDSTYRRQGNKITIVRKYEDRTPGPTCTPQDDKKSRHIARDVQKDLRSQIIYQPLD